MDDVKGGDGKGHAVISTKHARRVGGLAVALGTWLAAMAHPGIVVADTTADPSSDASTVGGPAQGGPEAKTELGVVSSGGSTPSMGASSVEAGSGSDATSSGPDRASAQVGSGSTATGPVGSGSTGSGLTGSGESLVEPAPGVVVRSSGGALTSNLTEQTSHPAVNPTVSPTAGRAEERTVRAVATPPRSDRGSRGVEFSPPPTRVVVVPQMAVARSAATPLGVGTARVPVVKSGTPDGVVDTAAMGASPDDGEPPVDTEPDDDPGLPDWPSAPAPVQAFTGALAAALASLALTSPGSPVEDLTLWAVLAFTRRQFESGLWYSPPGLLANPRQTEMIVADGNAPVAVVEDVDRVTGRVAGRVDVGGVDGDPLTYELVAPVDRRLGVVSVHGATGRWTFTPNQVTRLAAELSHGGGVVPFAIALSDGRTIRVDAPVDPAEAVVTDTIEVGRGLTYGLAAVGDRLCVLNGSSDAAGNGSVTIIDTSTKAVVGTVEVGSMPFALAVRGRSVYVGNADDGTVSVVDAGSLRVVDVIEVGAHPVGLEVAGDRLYVADQAGTVSVIDLNDNRELARIPVEGGPFGVAATADRVYVTDYVGGTVAVVDQATHAAVTPVAGYPYFAAITGGRLYVANSATNALTVIDKSRTSMIFVAANTRAVDAIPAGAAPVDIVVRGDRLYASNVNTGTVTVLDVATNQPVETIAVGIQPGLMTATPDGRTIYVADVMAGTIRMISSVRHATGG